MNAYNNDKYIKWREEWREFLFSKCDFDKIDETLELDNGYYIHNYTVKEEFNQNKNIEVKNGGISRLYNKQGQLIYEWISTYYQSRISDIIHHSNGKDYLIFTEDLYGYSVLELNALKIARYFPEISFYKNENFSETFIWTDFHYNHKNNYLAIGGCIWAAPSSLILVDFSNPLEIKEEDQWIDIHGIIDPTFERFNDIDFKKWDGDNLHLIAENSCTEKPENLTLSLDKLLDHVM